MQHSQYLYDVLLKEKKVIYLCKFTFNPKINFCLVYLDCELCPHACLQIITTMLEQCVQEIGTDSPGPEYHSALAIESLSVSPGVCQDPKLGCRLDGNSVAEKRSKA